MHLIFMKKKGWLALAMVLLSSTLFVKAQDNRSQLKLGKMEFPVETIYLQEKGFLVLTDFLLRGKNKDLRLIYYDAKGNRQWEKPIENHYGPSGTVILITSPSGQVTYAIEMKGEEASNTLEFNGKTHYITRITREGQVKTMDMKGKKEFGKSLQAIFCDDAYLYYLASENGWEINKKKKAEERLILNRFDRNTLKWEQFYFKLPPLKALEDATFWHFLGQAGNQNYLIATRYGRETGENFADILKFNNQAEITEKFSIDFSLEGKYNRPASALSIPRQRWTNMVDMAFGRTVMWSRNIANGSFSPALPANPDGANMVTTSATPLLPGAFGYWHLDSEHNYLYNYGLLGPKPFKSVGPVYEGFYIRKYDLKGNLIWKVAHTDVPELLDEKQFKVHRKPYERQINLKVLADETLNFSAHVPAKLFSFEITPDGRVEDDLVIKEKERMPANNMVQNSSRKLKSEAYVKANPVGKKDKFTTYSNFYSSVGEILMKFDARNAQIDILYFSY